MATESYSIKLFQQKTMLEPTATDHSKDLQHCTENPPRMIHKPYSADYVSYYSRLQSFNEFHRPLDI